MGNCRDPNERRIGSAPGPDAASTTLAFQIQRYGQAASKPGVDALAVGHATRAGKVVLDVDLGQTGFGLETLAPEKPSLLAGEGLHQKRHARSAALAPGGLRLFEIRAARAGSSANLRGQENAVFPNNRGGGSNPFQRRFPENIFGSAPANWGAGFARDAVARGAAPLRPVLGMRQHGEKEDKNESKHHL